jgi:hypothetical protein
MAVLTNIKNTLLKRMKARILIVVTDCRCGYEMKVMNDEALELCRTVFPSSAAKRVLVDSISR